ncbi:hypothetical protein N7513_007265 [Penicillium frequentans]|nr:hypothetical protein N7513_007265 [Penicillium glabrum]
MDCWYGRKIASIFSRKKKRTLQIGYPFNARKDEKEESILISNPEANISYASGTLPYSQEAIAASITRAHLSEIIGTDLPAGFIEINCPTLAELRGDTQN